MAKLSQNNIQSRMSSVEHKLVAIQKNLSAATVQNIKPPHSKFGISTADSISILAAVITLGVLSATAYQAYLMRKHNRLVLKPHLEIIRKFDISEPISFVIENHGAGTAIIDTIFFKLDGKVLDISTPQGIINFCSVLGLDENNSIIFTMGSGEILLAPNSTVVPVLFQDSNKNEVEHDKIFQLVKNLDIHVKYKCAYDCNYEKELKHLDM